MELHWPGPYGRLVILPVYPTAGKKKTLVLHQASPQPARGPLTPAHMFLCSASGFQPNHPCHPPSPAEVSKPDSIKMPACPHFREKATLAASLCQSHTQKAAFMWHLAGSVGEKCDSGSQGFKFEPHCV